MVTRWDVVVVGAGPAGSATAARLAGAGHQVLLLDRTRFPRRKPCGECVNPAGVAALASLGVAAALEATGPARLQGWRVHAPGAAGFDGSFPEDRWGWGIRRELLDAALLEHAAARGAEVRGDVRVVDLLRQGAQVVGVRGADGTELRARLVVGADGLRSVVVRRLGLIRRSPRLRKLALTAHLRGVSGPPGRGELRVRGRTCLGIAPVGAGLANAALVVPGGTHVGDRAAFFDGMLREFGIADGERTDEVLATGPFDWPVRSAVADGALLVGDAAGYYDPFTGQGIFRALRSAELAAPVIGAALARGDTSARALAPYERARRRAFGAGEWLQHGVEAVVSRPRAFALATQPLRRFRSVANALIRATGDLGWTA